jgi:NAD(P)H-hydrate repair Nnr-like enzyme with NAD(P)H-hydrate epimerase domain
MEVPMDALMKSLGDKLAPDMQNLVEVAAGYGKVVVVCGSGRRAQTVVGRLRRVCHMRPAAA